MGWLAKIITSIGTYFLRDLVDYLARWIREYFEEKKRLEERAKAQAEAKKKWEAAIADPNKTKEERAKEYANYLNSGS